jgi:16S rRNA (guanine527-N7)-methyltransferase
VSGPAPEVPELRAALPPAVSARLGELADEYGLTREQLERMATLLRLIAIDDLAPTTVRDPAMAVDQHVADSLTALEIEAVRGARSAADLGAGAGVPGLVLAAALPGSHWSLIESVRRKTVFMERAIAAMGLANARPLNLRSEEWREGRAANDVVTARAVAAAPVVLEYGAPLLRLGGSLVDWRTRMTPEEAADALAAAAALGLEAAGEVAVRPFPDAHSRYLYLYVKVGPTPDRYPRRAGTARKRPLGASTRA